MFCEKVVFIFKGKPNILEAPSSQSEPVGKSARFLCRAEGNPAPTISWKKHSGQVIGNGGRFSIDANGTLIISNLQKSDSDMYVCVASNEYGDREATARLFVLGKPVD